VTEDLLALALQLRDRGEPFVLATVVRCERPTSAKPGAKALIRADGSVTGWIGGACAEPTVVREALAALRDGQPRFVSLVGQGSSRPGGQEGVLEYPMTCHSGGTLEIYVEPTLPRPQLVLVGHGPVLEALAALAGAAELTVVTVGTGATADTLARVPLTAQSFVVVATHGTGDEDALARALQADVRYVSLVASRKRAAAVVERLRQRGVPAERLGALKSPAGLDLGAVTPEEIAVSILAEIVQVRRSPKTIASDLAMAAPGAMAPARDPICGMLVDPATALHRSQTSDGPVYFCCPGCKDAYDRQQSG
jgi:xanthine dehydrogenase accessory factor